MGEQLGEKHGEGGGFSALIVPSEQTIYISSELSREGQKRELMWALVSQVDDSARAGMSRYSGKTSQFANALYSVIQELGVNIDEVFTVIWIRIPSVLCRARGVLKLKGASIRFFLSGPQS